MRKILLLSLFLFVIGLSFSTASAIPTYIDSCDQILSDNTNADGYALNQSITQGSNIYCIEINNSIYTFDCQGYTITGSSSYDVYLHGADGVVFKNCIFNGSSDQALTVENSDFVTVQNNTFNGTYESKVGVEQGSDDLTFKNNRIIAAGTAIQVQFYTNNLRANITNNTFSGTGITSSSGELLRLSDTNDSIIYNNSFLNYGNQLKLAAGSVNDTVYANTFNISDSYGGQRLVSLDGNSGLATRHNVSYNTFVGNAYSSIEENSAETTDRVNYIGYNNISCTQSVGIYVHSHNATVVNNNVTGTGTCTLPIYLQIGSNSNVSYNSITNSYSSGSCITTQGSNDTLISYNNLSGGSMPLRIDNNGDRLTIDHNIISNFPSGNGIWIAGSAGQYHNITNNYLSSGSGGNGISLSTGRHNVINNTIYNVGTGIVISGTSFISVLNNTVDTVSVGLSFNLGSNNVVNNNTFKVASVDGIFIGGGSSYNNITNNKLPDDSDGIRVSNSDVNRFENNTITSSTTYGVWLQADSDNNTFNNNTITGSVTWDWRSTDTSNNNVFNNTNFGGTVASFAYDGNTNFRMKKISAVGGGPGYNWGKALRIENESAPMQWFQLNMSYDDADVYDEINGIGTREDLLYIGKFDVGTGWDYNMSHYAASWARDTVNNVVSINITSFSDMQLIGPWLVTQCQAMDTAGQYVLNNTINGPLNTGRCFYSTVNQNGIEVDGEGHTVTGFGLTTDSWAFKNFGSNLTVKNCNLTDWVYYIYQPGQYAKVINNTFYSKPSFSGMYMWLNGGDAYVYNNTITDSVGLAQAIYNQENNAIIANNVIDYSNAFNTVTCVSLFSGSQNCTVANNTIKGCFEGLTVQAENALIQNNTFINSTGYDINPQSWSCNNTVTSDNVGTSGHRIVWANGSFTENINDTVLSELILCGAQNVALNNVTVIGTNYPHSGQQLVPNPVFVMDGCTDIYMSNMNITDTYRGIDITGVTNFTLVNSSISHTRNTLISVTSQNPVHMLIQNNVLNDSTAHSEMISLSYQQDCNAIIDNNTILEGQNMINTGSLVGCVITNNKMYAGSNYGILGSGSHHNVTNNYFEGIENSCIALGGQEQSYNNISYNIINDSSWPQGIYAIDIDNPDHELIDHNIIYGMTNQPWGGVSLSTQQQQQQQQSYSNVTNNVMNVSQEGISIVQDDHNYIYNNTIGFSGQQNNFGMHLDGPVQGGTYNLVLNNNVTGYNGGRGIWLQEEDFDNVTGNTVVMMNSGANVPGAIYVEGQQESDNIVDYNNVTCAGEQTQEQYGIRIQNSWRDQVLYNNVTNCNNGITAGGATPSIIIDHNYVFANQENGSQPLYIQAADNMTITNNYFEGGTGQIFVQDQDGGNINDARIIIDNNDFINHDLTGSYYFDLQNPNFTFSNNYFTGYDNGQFQKQWDSGNCEEEFIEEGLQLQQQQQDEASGRTWILNNVFNNTYQLQYQFQDCFLTVNGNLVNNVTQTQWQVQSNIGTGSIFNITKNNYTNIDAVEQSQGQAGTDGIIYFTDNKYDNIGVILQTNGVQLQYQTVEGNIYFDRNNINNIWQFQMQLDGASENVLVRNNTFSNILNQAQQQFSGDQVNVLNNSFTDIVSQEQFLVNAELSSTIEDNVLDNTSDTQFQVQVPSGDLYVHNNDFTNLGNLQQQYSSGGGLTFEANTVDNVDSNNLQFPGGGNNQHITDNVFNNVVGTNQIVISAVLMDISYFERNNLTNNDQNTVDCTGGALFQDNRYVNNRVGLYGQQGIHDTSFVNEYFYNNTDWDIDFNLDDSGNTFTNCIFNDTNLSIPDYFGAFNMKSTPDIIAPTNYTGFGKAMNITNKSESAWVNLIINYKDSEVTLLNESSLQLAQWNGSWDVNMSNFANYFALNTNANTINTNITVFHSIFQPLGVQTGVTVNPGGNWWINEPKAPIDAKDQAVMIYKISAYDKYKGLVEYEGNDVILKLAGNPTNAVFSGLSLEYDRVTLDTSSISADGATLFFKLDKRVLGDNLQAIRLWEYVDGEPLSVANAQWGQLDYTFDSEDSTYFYVHSNVQPPLGIYTATVDAPVDMNLMLLIAGGFIILAMTIVALRSRRVLF